MALQVAAGTFTKGGGATVTVGFRPAAVVFWTPNATAQDTFSNQLDVGLGLLADSPGATRQQAMWVWADNGKATSDAGAGLNPAKAIAVKGWTLTAALTATGFTVTWQSSPPSATRVHYLALGGDGVQGNVLSQVIPAGLAPNSVVSVRGAGFNPTSVVAVAQRDATAADKTVGIGAADDSGGQWALGGATQNSVNPPNTARIWREDALIALPDSNGNPACVAQVVAMRPDGLDLQLLTPPTAAVNVYLLVMRGLAAKAATGAKPTGTAPETGTIAAGFTPVGALFGGTFQTAAGGAANHRGQLSGSDGTHHAAAAWLDRDGTSPSLNRGISRDDKAWVQADNSTPAEEADATAAFSASGATLTWSPNNAVASRLGAFLVGTLTHPLGGSSDTLADVISLSTLVTPPLFFGASTTETDTTGAIGPAAVFDGVLSTETDLPAAMLRADSTIRGASSTTETGPTGRLVLTAKLSGQSSSDSETVATGFGRGTILGGVTSSDTDLTGALATGIRWANVASTTESDLSGYFRLLLPDVPVAGAGEVPGTVNWHLNPSAEGSLDGWAGWNGGVVALDNTSAWDGSTAVLVTAGAGARGVAIQGGAGLELTGKARPVWAQVRAKGAVGATVTFWGRLHYVDGSVVDGDSTGATLTGSWDQLIAAAVVADPAKLLNQAELVVTLDAAGSFRADGAQIEEDRGAGATRLAIGGYGETIGTWLGPAHRSPSVRLPFGAAVAAPGRGGTTIIEARMYRATWDNQWLEDISDGVISAKVTLDPSRDVAWTLDATLTLPGWKGLTPFLDWVAPWMRVTKPDGSVLEGQLGLYFVLPSPASRSEWGGTVQLQAKDPCWLLSKQGFDSALVVKAGVEKMRALRSVLNSAVLTGDGPQGDGTGRRYAVPDAGSAFKRDREWEKKTTKLDVANDLCQSAGMYPLWSTKAGIVTTRKMGGDDEKRLRTRHPVREWAANAPLGWADPEGWVPRQVDAPSELVGAVDTSPKMDDAATDIWLINDDPDGGRIFVKKPIRNRKNQRSFLRDGGREHVKKLYAPYLDDNATAQEVADALADEISARNTTVSFSVLPDPSVELAHEVVRLAFFDVSADQVAGGRYAVHRVTYGFTPSDCLMQVEAGLVSSADDPVEDAA